jgi:hypothetical protein
VTTENWRVPAVDLRQLLTTNLTADAIVRTFAARKRNSAATELDSIVDLPDVARTGSRLEVRRNAIAFFRGLEEMDIGQLVIGRRGKSTRFVWTRPLVDFAAESLLLLDGADHAPSREFEPAPETGRTGPPVSIKHSFALRRDISVTFELPEDFTPAEAERLTALIKAIPFVRG